MFLYILLLVPLLAQEGNAPQPVKWFDNQIECENVAGQQNAEIDRYIRTEKEKKLGLRFVCAKLLPPSA